MPRGGRREGAGRKPMPPENKPQSRSVTLRIEEWERLAALAEDGSPTKEAARRVRASLEGGT